MSAFTKINFRCVVSNFLQPVHLITDNVNEQRVAAVQSTEKKRTRKVSRGFRRQAMADRTNSSDLEIY